MDRGKDRVIMEQARVEPRTHSLSYEEAEVEEDQTETE